MVLDIILNSINIADWFSAEYLCRWFMDNANYWMIFLLMMVESSFIPFPSEVVVPPAAYLACTGDDMNIVMVVVVATLGALAGAFVNYYLSMWIGRPLVYKFADSRLGHACLLNSAKVEKAEKYFDKHGAASTFFGRLIPAIRQLISIPAGLARMNVGVFALYTALGAVIWNSALAYIGYLLSLKVSRDDLFEMLEKYNGYLTWIGFGILLLCILFILYNAFKKKTQTTNN